jgi:hypothetical protein
MENMKSVKMGLWWAMTTIFFMCTIAGTTYDLLKKQLSGLDFFCMVCVAVIVCLGRVFESIKN